MRQHLSNTSREALRTIKAEYRADKRAKAQRDAKLDRIQRNEERFETWHSAQLTTFPIKRR